MFGSALGDDFGPGSDIDLLVEFEPPRVTGRQVDAAFRRLGFAPVKGAPRWRHPDGRMTVIHLHPTRPVPIGTLRHILSLARVSVDEFASAL